MASPSEQLVNNLKASVLRHAAELEAERSLSDSLARAVMILLPPDPQPEHQHSHLLGDARVCCLIAAHRIDASTRRRAMEALEAWSHTRSHTITQGVA